MPSEYLASPLSKQQQKPAKKTEEEIKEEEELQLAIAISQSEAEKGNKKKTSDDADLELAIAMSKKEHEKSEKKPSTVAPPTSTVTTSAVTGEKWALFSKIVHVDFICKFDFVSPLLRHPPHDLYHSPCLIKRLRSLGIFCLILSLSF